MNSADVLRKTVAALAIYGGSKVFYVVCPYCQDRIEIPSNAVGPERTDPWNVVGCDECGVTFDYDDEEIVAAPDDASR